VLRVHLSDDPDAGLASLRVALQAALDLASGGVSGGAALDGPAHDGTPLDGAG